MDKNEIFKNVISGIFLQKLTQHESVQNKRDEELTIISNSMKGFQGIYIRDLLNR